MIIKQFLTIKDIAQIDLRIAKGETLYSIGRSYPNLNRSQNAAFWDYLRSVKNPKSTEILGSKTIPYYENEKDMGVIPEYKWEDLSEVEKELLTKKSK